MARRPKPAQPVMATSISAQTGRHLVVCCDGTGNDVSGNLSNVFKFYRCLEKSGRQVCYYDPGVGTFAESKFWKFVEDANRIIALATGFGLDANVLDAYRFLVENWREGDRISLFGFSRGAYTVRVLAGMINMVGLLEPHQFNLAPYALKVYRAHDSEMGEENRFYRAARFRKSVSDHARKPQFHLMGLWDTVSSVYELERSGVLYWPRKQALPYTDHNASVMAVRQALAIDERRRMFPAVRWNPLGKMPDGHDHREIWFAGVHADIGGGYREAESALAKIPLLWMIEEALRFGLIFKPDEIDRIVRGIDAKAGGGKYAAPAPEGLLHDSLTLGWLPFEYVPRRARSSDNPAVRAKGGWYLPRGEPRFIPQGALIHDSVRLKRERDAGYRPPNLPADAVFVER